MKTNLSPKYYTEVKDEAEADPDGEEVDGYGDSDPSDGGDDSDDDDGLMDDPYVP